MSNVGIMGKYSKPVFKLLHNIKDEKGMSKGFLEAVKKVPDPKIVELESSDDSQAKNGTSGKTQNLKKKQNVQELKIMPNKPSYNPISRIGLKGTTIQTIRNERGRIQAATCISKYTEEINPALMFRQFYNSVPPKTEIYGKLQFPYAQGGYGVRNQVLTMGYLKNRQVPHGIFKYPSAIQNRYQRCAKAPVAARTSTLSTNPEQKLSREIKPEIVVNPRTKLRPKNGRKIRFRRSLAAIKENSSRRRYIQITPQLLANVATFWPPPSYLQLNDFLSLVIHSANHPDHISKKT